MPNPKAPFKFHFPIFIVSFLIAFLYVYYIGPARKDVIKYPTPYNYNTLIYRDSSENCFIYEPTKVSCTANPMKTIPQPVV